MDTMRSKAIPDTIDESALVLDVGGGAQPFKRADYVIDGLSYEGRGALTAGTRCDGERFSKDSWVQQDLCLHEAWPFEDKQFDYAVCTHVLEDVRDPVWVCSEIMRVAKAGYIETPSRTVEQSRGVEHPLYAGYYHHRWLVSVDGNRILFRFKPHSLHCLREAIVTDVNAGKTINPEHASLSFEWRDSFVCEEVLDFDEDSVNRELCAFARLAREVPELTVDAGLSLRQKAMRFIYFQRLKFRR